MTALYVFAILFFIVSAAVHILLSEDPDITLYSDGIAVVAAILPVMTCLYALVYFEKGALERKVLLIFFAGLLLWLIGETLWLYYEDIVKVNPFPSWADAAWILGYPCLSVALILQYKTVRVKLERTYEVGIALVVLFIGILAFFLFGYLITAAEEFTLLEKVISIFYPIGDLVLLYFALLITGLYWAGRLSYAWLLIALGIISYVVGDLWYAYLEWEEIYWGLTWHPVDLTWIIGDLLLFLGAAKYRISFEELV
jgi:hypothetical protein